jgi:hypothetical protein
MRRHTTGFTKVFWFLFFLSFTLPKNALSYLIRRDMEHGKAFLKAVAWNVTHLSNGQRLKLFA